MRRLVGTIAIITLLVGLLAVVAGCAGGTTPPKEGTNIVTPSGNINVKKSGNTVTVTKGSTKKTWTATSSSEKALDFPVPSSAKLVSGTAILVESSAEKWAGANFYSDDDVATVSNYYKDNLKSMSGYSDTSTTINGKAVGLYSVQSGGIVKSVIVRESESGEQGKTWIQIATATGAGT
jgi:hypothetical protein